MRRDRTRTLSFSIPETTLARLDIAYQDGDAVSRSALIVAAIEYYLAKQQGKKAGKPLSFKESPYVR